MLDTKRVNVQTSTHVERLDINPLAYIDLKAGDIVDMDFGSTPYSPICGEQVGYRPVLILKDIKGTSKQQLIPVVKLTRQSSKRCSWHIRLNLDGLKESYFLIEHQGSYSRERIRSRVRANVGDDILKQVRDGIAKYLELETE